MGRRVGRRVGRKVERRVERRVERIVAITIMVMWATCQNQTGSTWMPLGPDI